MVRTRQSLLVFALATVAALSSGQRTTYAGSAVRRISTSASGEQGANTPCTLPSCNNGDTNFHSISANGRYAAFASLSNNLVTNDTNGTTDIFVKDLVTGGIVRASTDSSGNQANATLGPGSFTGSHHPSISDDGRYVAFESYANNLVPADINDQLDIFIKDLQLGTTERVLFGGVAGTANSFNPVISGNGRYVAFTSASTNLYPGFGSPFRIYRYDRDTGGMATVAGHQTTAGNRDFDVNAPPTPAISDDGRYVAFTGKLVGGTFWQVYRRDVSTSAVALVSAGAGGALGNNHSAHGNTLFEWMQIDITGDGRFVVFTSDASNLAAGDANGTRDVYLRDTATDTTSLISRDSAGTSLGKTSFNVSIADSGRYVAFDGVTTPDLNAYVYDRTLNRLWQTPYTPQTSGTGNGPIHPVLSDNGRRVMFHANSPQLVPGDTNGITDFFVTDPLFAASHRSSGDFDGDGLTEFAVFRPSTGVWYMLGAGTGAFSGVQFGQNGDVPVTGDFDGDSFTDTAVFRPGNGTWYFLLTTTGFTARQFGLNGDRPLAADFDGDARTDIAVFRPSNGTWYIELSLGGYRFQQFGLTGDVPMAGDFDGDGRADLAVFRPSTNVWYLLDSSTGGFRAIGFGLAGDVVAPADYNGDGITDLGVFRPSTGTWYVYNTRRMTPQSSPPLQYTFSAFAWGTSGDVPAPGDFDGDGRADVAVYRPATGAWYVLQSGGGVRTVGFGLNGDIPIPSPPS
jgi:Tol biopolymer transport system component